MQVVSYLEPIQPKPLEHCAYEHGKGDAVEVGRHVALLGLVVVVLE